MPGSPHRLVRRWANWWRADTSGAQPWGINRNSCSLQIRNGLPAVLRKFHETKERCAAEVSIWGTGRPHRVSSCRRLGGRLSVPDGELRTPRKLLDVSQLRGLGWRARMVLREGIEGTYRWFRQEYGTAKTRVPALAALG